MPKTLFELIKELSQPKLVYERFPVKIKLLWHDKKYFNTEPLNRWEVYNLLTDIKRCEVKLNKLNFVHYKTKEPLQVRFMPKVRVIRKNYVRFSLWIKDTGRRADYQGQLVPEFKSLKAATAFKKFLLHNSKAVEIRGRRYFVKRNEKILLSNSAEAVDSYRHQRDKNKDQGTAASDTSQGTNPSVQANGPL